MEITYKTKKESEKVIINKIIFKNQKDTSF